VEIEDDGWKERRERDMWKQRKREKKEEREEGGRWEEPSYSVGHSFP
jgi:hypothetical protein